jgi:hypothetical protein
MIDEVHEYLLGGLTGAQLFEETSEGFEFAPSVLT